jgi:3-phosphoshikimate 1-carboxyvinyltransferase
MRARIEPGLARGCVGAPPSKSVAHRLAVCAALSAGESVIRNYASSEDLLATLDCATALGAACTLRGDTLTVRGGRGGGDGVFPCRESGSTLRLFIPVALTRCEHVRFTGAKRLLERGIGVYETLFRARGIAVDRSDGAIELRGALTPGEYVLPGDVSSQFVSGLLLALPLLAGDSVVRVLPPLESRSYVNLTCAALRRFGVRITEEGDSFAVPGGQAFRAQEAAVEGDWSNAAFLLALNALGAAVRVTGLDPASEQGDRAAAAFIRRLEAPGADIDLAENPDLAPVLFALAAAKHGAVFSGTRRLRLKESDRSAAMAAELAKFGVDVTVAENAVTVSGGPLHAPAAALDGHNDHRIVMALAVLCTVTGGVIDGAEAVRKSWPDFFSVLRQLGLEVTLEA